MNRRRRRSYFAQELELQPGHAGWTNLRQQFRQPLLILMITNFLIAIAAGVRPVRRTAKAPGCSRSAQTRRNSGKSP